MCSPGYVSPQTKGGCPLQVGVRQPALLLLGDLATITQEKRPYSWISGAPTLSPEAQTALTTSLLGLTLKLTGAKLANFKHKLPGGKMRAKSRTEVVAYLAPIQVCVDTKI